MTADIQPRETVVLLVEDDRDDFYLTQDLLQSIQREKHRVVWAASYEAAKLELEERAFDVALVDYRIDGRTGLEFIAEVGSNFPHCPMILLTGLQDPGIDLAAQEAGAVDYLAKDSLTVELLDRSIRYARRNTERFALLDRVLTSAAAGVVSINAKGVPVVWNKRALEALGLDRGQRGKVTAALIREAMSGLCIEGRLPDEVTASNGRAYQLGLSDGPDGGTVVVMHDISSRARTEHLLRQAAADAEAASLAKSSFLATMSHELRTPLNGILGMARVLAATELDDGQRDHLSVIRSSGESLLQIINDILDISKIEAGRVELENVEFSIGTLLDDVIKLLAPTAFSKGLELGVFLDPCLPEQMHGDPLRVKQILINLVGNAVKFTCEGSIILSATRELSDGAPTVRIAIIDTGSGIAADKVEKLFKKFSQVDSSTTRNHSGTGLGLALCKELTRLMNGTIWYEPGESGGSVFQVRLPLPEEHEAVEKARAGRVRAAGGTRVLLSTPSHALASVLDAYAGAMGQSLIWTPSEREAVSALQQNGVAAIVYDRMNNPTDAKALIKAARPLNGGRGPALLLIDQYPAKGHDVHSGGPAFDEILQRPLGLGYCEALNRQLQRASSRPNPIMARAEPAARKGKLCILMAEDNAPNRLVASALLRSAGYDLDIAEDGQEAVEKAVSRRYDVILMDVQMPRLDGLAATRRLRANEAMADIPIIGLTASAMKQDRDICLQAGMSDYLPKPVDWDKLLGLLEQIEKALKSRSTAA